MIHTPTICGRAGMAQGRRHQRRAPRPRLDEALYLDVMRRRTDRGQAARSLCFTRCNTCWQQSRDNSSASAPGRAQAYPSRSKDGDIVDFSTFGRARVGVTLFASLVQDYLRLKRLVPRYAAGRMIARRRRRARRGQHLRASRRLKHDVGTSGGSSITTPELDPWFPIGCSPIDALCEMFGWRS